MADDTKGSLFRPQPDITAYELACAFQAMLDCQNALFMPDMMAKMPTPALRHFEEVKTFSEKTMLLISAG